MEPLDVTVLDHVQWFSRSPEVVPLLWRRGAGGGNEAGPVSRVGLLTAEELPIDGRQQVLAVGKRLANQRRCLNETTMTI